MQDLIVAVVGATGAAGGKVIELLEERKFPVKELRAFASSRSEGVKIPFNGRELTVHEAKPEGFIGADVVFFAAGVSTSKALVRWRVRPDGRPRRPRW